MIPYVLLLLLLLILFKFRCCPTLICNHGWLQIKNIKKQEKNAAIGNNEE